jgi:hypothetical protein
MSNLQQGWITIDTVIKDYLDESEQSNHKYFKCFNLAFRGMEQLGLDFFYNIKSVKLPVNPNQTVELPLDYVNYTKVGVFNDIGEVIPLTYNSKLTTFADLFPDRLDRVTDNTLYNYYSPQNAIFYNYYNGAGYGNIYGLPSGSPFVGNFKIDAKNSLILLNDTFYYKYIVLEYIASPTEGEEYFIPVQFREALLAYIAWRDIANVPSSRKGSLGDKRDRRHEFYNERRLAQARFRPFYLDAAYELNLESQRLTVKA